MANTSPISFLLNQDSTQQQVVSAPAFSLTKVLAAAAVIITPIATLLVVQLKSVTLSGGNYAALAAALLGFLSTRILCRARSLDCHVWYSESKRGYRVDRPDGHVEDTA